MVLDDEVLALDIPEFAQSLPEGVDRRVAIRVGKARTEETDSVHFPRLLRRGGEWGQEKAEGEDETEDAASHGGVLQYTRALTVSEQRYSPPR
jgi:hypothetical protein